MQLTSTDETDLLIPLYSGVHDQAAWRTFLTRIRRRTGADYASLIFAQGDTPMHLSKEVFSGRDLREEARRQGLEPLYEKDRLPYDRLRPGRVYQSAEFIIGDAQFREFHTIFNRTLGLSDERIVRIKEQEGTNAWLMLARNQQFFSATDSALLTAVVPHVTVALRSFVLVERQRIRAAINRDALARAGVGWIAFSREARIIDVDPGLVPLLRDTHGSDKLLGERLYVDSPQTRQSMIQAARLYAGDPHAPTRAVRLSEEPPLEALLIPMIDQPEAALTLPVMLAFCCLPRCGARGRHLLLGDLFGLSPREAELALAMSDGQTISEAAAAMGLTEETARGYSKRAYTKMGVRGQVELVRKIFLSIASLA